MKVRHTLLLLGIIIFLFELLVVPKKALSFDTGHHFDLTQEALQEEGFGDTAIKTVQVQNWLTDYFTSSPTSKIKSDVEKLHFDNLISTTQNRNYWGRLTINTKNAVQAAASENDPLKFLTALGISIHAVQDFYTHSNWVETHPASGDYHRTDTWFDVGLYLPKDDELYTGWYPNDKQPAGGKIQHGDYVNGLNHDSYIRPRWEESYVFAYAASRQWVNAAHTWVNKVNPGFWQSVQRFEVNGADRSALDFDLEAAYRLSEWVKPFEGADGHWKGNGSGSTTEFATFAAGWTASPDSRFVSEFKKRGIHRLISDGLTGDAPPNSSVPAVPSIDLNRRAVKVRTLRVAEKDNVGFFEQKIDSPGGEADFYANITVAGQTFTEAMQLDRSSISPAWTTIKFIPTSTSSAAIHYELWDEDGGIRGDDDHTDIHPSPNKYDLDFTFSVDNHSLTGDITGVHDSEGNAVQSEGSKPDSDRAVVQFLVTEKKLVKERGLKCSSSLHFKDLLQKIEPPQPSISLRKLAEMLDLKPPISLRYVLEGGSC